ncbi:MAG: DUF58 domain-containing protein, partial [Planctomycetales bacterium]|nr:DUF58 domain-containing protein [Planctomycetales bacterium]
SVSRELVVWPKTTPLTSIPSLGGDIADVIGMLFDRPGNEGDMIGVRPFRDGDRLRSIHWAQTARRDSLIVTERQAAARRWIVIAVDIPAFCNTSLSADGLRRQQLEMAIRVSASIAREFHAHHADVRFVVGDTDLCVSPDASGLHQLLDALARFQIQPESFRPPTGFGRKSLAIVVTTDQRRSEWERESGLRGSLRLVLIDAANPAREVDRNVWINIESDSDGSHQLRHQWERVCHVSAAK